MNHCKLVVASKPNERCLCSVCFYCKRGSFAGLTVIVFLKIIFSIPALLTKLLATIYSSRKVDFCLNCS